MPKKTIGNLEARPKPVTYFKAWRLIQDPPIGVEAAAAGIGIDRSTLSRIESLTRGTTPQVFASAARLYGCTPGDLYSPPPLWPSHARTSKRVRFIEDRSAAFVAEIDKNFPETQAGELTAALAKAQAQRLSGDHSPLAEGEAQATEPKAQKKVPPKHP